MVGSRIQGRTYTLPGRTSHCLELSGRPMNQSGLCELWVECDIMGANAAQHVMDRDENAQAHTAGTMATTASLGLHVLRCC